MSDKRPRVVAREPIFRGWNTLEMVTIEAPDRNGVMQRHRREVMDHGEAVVVLPFDPERRIAYLVRQWRAPLVTAEDAGFLLEACAGIIDPGESPEVAVRREAEEEIGLDLGALKKVGAVYSSAGTLTELMHLFLAEVGSGSRAAAGGGKAGEGEEIEIVEMPFDQLFTMAERGGIDDAKTLVLVQRLMLDELKANSDDR